MLARLENAGLSPSPEADEATLVRRLFLDLTGLPPTYEDVAAFRDDPSATRFDRLVERLLATREYGERWARHWLDVARYADTKGYVDGGQVRFAFAYTYRDYVIRAVAEDLPFDEFVRDQLAADARSYAADEKWRLAGMGFLTVGRRFNHNYYDTLDDQIDVISRGLQGLTLSCARCHDHKFDPLPTADYYSLYGILASSFEPQHPDLPVIASNQSDAVDHLNELRSRADKYTAEFVGLHEKIQHELRAFAGDYLVYLVQESDVHRESEQNPLKTERTILRGPTAYGYGAIRRWREAIARLDHNDPVFGLWHRMWNVPRDAFVDELQRHLDDETLNPVLRQHVRVAQPRSMIQLARAYGDLLEKVYADEKAREERSSDEERIADPTLSVARRELRDAVFGANAASTLTRLESIDCYHLDEHTAMRNLAGKVETLSVEVAAAAPRAMVLRPRPQPLEPVVFLRGQPNLPGPRVARQVPAAFSAIGAETGRFQRPAGDDRQAVAEALVSPANPLTARVIVNRVWDWHFGRPLVATPSDFGIRSAPPSHPELLDYLAHWFVEQQWSLKRLHRLIMSSSTYRQASQSRPECLGVDPENSLLWRFNPRRVEWEVVRDSLLSVSGRLQPRSGGRPLELQPADPNGDCRTIYLQIDRQHIPEFARSFDFPAPDFTVPRRPVTAVPQQQLFFMNSPFVQRQAAELGTQAADRDDDDIGRFRWLHRRVFARETTLDDSQIDASLAELRDQLQVGEGPTLWELVAHGLLQSNEFVYLE